MTLEEPVRAQPGTPEPADRKPLAGLVDDRGERILRTALSLTALLVACSVVGGVALGVVDASGMRIRVLMLGITLVTLAALRRWGVTAAVRFFLYSGVALVASHSLAVSGVRTPVLLALAPMLVLAGWFLGRREVFSLGAAAAASVAGMAHLEYVGLLVPAPRTVFDYLWALVVVIPVSSVIGIHAHSRFVHQLTLAQLGAKRLQLINELSSQVHGMRDRPRAWACDTIASST